MLSKLDLTKLVLFCVLAWSAAVAAELPPETIKTEVLSARPSPHWVWVSDVVVPHLEAGKAFLIDGDSGEMLGMLTTGVLFMALALPSDYSEIYSAETYYSRGVRGDRSDIVSIYDSRTLMPKAEIDIPDKRAANFPTGFNSTLTDDDRFLLIYNFTPAQSVSVVDVKARTFIGEIETSGCALVYPAGARRFFSLCGDGSLLIADLDDFGKSTDVCRTPLVFDPNVDPIQEDGVRAGAQWLFASYEGYIYPLEASGKEITFPPRWSLLTQADRDLEWRTGGGMQLLAVHEGLERLYVVMNQAGPHGQDDPGTEIWVFDLDSKKRRERIKTQRPVTSIEVTRDKEPLLFSVFADEPAVDVYDARTGRFLRTIDSVGATPMILQTPR